MPDAPVTRRSFAAGAAALTIVPSHVLGQSDTAPSDKLNIAAVGVGGVGVSYLKGCESENIVALCDVDDSLAAKTFAKYPRAKTYRDYRVMLEKEKGIDAVIVATPDHSHATVVMAALQLGKAVYCAKPLTRTISEVRQLTQTAAEKKVATQMSVQTCATDPALSTAEWVQAGAVGAVREVHVWTDRPVWPQGLSRPGTAETVPSCLDWDLWLGPAPARPYHPVYHPFNWRGWTDFGTGALGDMACHAFHVVFNALSLDAPVSVQATTDFVYRPALHGDADMSWIRARKVKTPETFPIASIVTWDFPARGELPAVRMHWYDGGLKPPRPAEYEPERSWPASGLLFVGDKGTLLSGFSGGPRLVPETRNKMFTPPSKTMRRTIGHYDEWIAAAKGGPPANCNFEFARLLTETALLGVAAQRTGRFLAWDAANMKFTNDAAANELIHPAYRSGWTLG